jgi:uncharacterized protein (DUF4415 family)
MKNAKPIVFTRLTDGTILRRRPDGSFRPVKDKTDYARLAKLTDDEIEKMAVSDPDHPGLDDNFWRSVDVGNVAPAKEAISIKLDRDVLAFFRKQGRGYQTRINAVLRSYMCALRKAG